MRRITAFIALGLLLAGCGADDNSASTSPETNPVGVRNDAAEPRTFVGADGVESEITDISRIVTLSGDLTEAVYALGLGESIVGRDVTTIYPPEAMSIPIVGIGRFLTAEGVLAENPTLVLGDTQTSPPDAIQQIRNAGVPVVLFEVPSSFQDLYRKAESIGEVLGLRQAGIALADEVRASIETAIANAPALDSAPNVAFVYSRGPDVMLFFGAGMTTNPVIEAAGARDAGAAIGIEGTVDVTPEAIVAASPDVIVTTQEGIDAFGGVEGFLAVPGIAETPAGQAGRILAYPEGDFLTFGPRIGEHLQRFIVDLRAELEDS